jgi:hypothetical protein
MSDGFDGIVRKDGPPGVPAEDLKLLATLEAKRAAEAKSANGLDPKPLRLPDSIATTIGGETVEVPELSWAAFKRARPIMEAAGAAIDWVEDREGTLKILAIALESTRPELTFEEIEERLSLREAMGMGTFLLELLRLSGIAQRGEVLAASGSSTSTSTDSSPNSSPAAAPPSTNGETSSGQ